MAVLKRCAPWLMACRPKTMSASVIPVLVGTLLANTFGTVNWVISLYALFVAVFLQIGTNLVNDAMDFKKGADTADRIGPVRVTQLGILSPEEVMFGAFVSFALALLFGIPLVYQGGWIMGVILALSVVSGYLYTGGSKPLAYHGYGDIFVMIFFGWVATMGVYYLQTGGISGLSFLAASQVGLLSTAIIAMNNLRDIVGDRKANKRTLPVIFGVNFGRYEVTCLIVVSYLLNFFWANYGYYATAFLPLLTLPIAKVVIKGIWSFEPGPIYNKFFGMTALLHMLFGGLLALGLALS